MSSQIDSIGVIFPKNKNGVFSPKIEIRLVQSRSRHTAVIFSIFVSFILSNTYDMQCMLLNCCMFLKRQLLPYSIIIPCRPCRCVFSGKVREKSARFWCCPVFILFSTKPMAAMASLGFVLHSRRDAVISVLRELSENDQG